MDREEILERSRQEKNDEGRTEAQNQGNRLGIVVVTGMFCFLAVFNYVFDYSNAVPIAMYSGFIVAEAYGKYRFDGRKRHLIWMAEGIAAMLISTIYHISEVMSAL